MHEEAVLCQFKAYLESNGVHLEILDRPEPPEATVMLNGEKTWIEITDAYLDRGDAIDLTSYAADDVNHVPGDGRVILEPDVTFSNALHNVIAAKYDKATMQNIANLQGSGILLVGIFTPYTTAAAVSRDEAVDVATLVAGKPVHVFSTIYVYEGTGERSFHMLYRK